MINSSIKFASVSASASGDNLIVAAETGKRIRVINYCIISAGTVNAKWRSNTTDKSGAFPLVANVGAVCPEADLGWLVTEVGEALNLNLSGAVLVAGHLAYVQE